MKSVREGSAIILVSHLAITKFGERLDYVIFNPMPKEIVEYTVVLGKE